MAGVKTLDDGNTRVMLLAAKPANPRAVTVAEATAVGAKYLSDQILAGDFDLGSTGSDTIPEKPLSASGNGINFGLSNFGGGFTVFRYYDPETGLPDATDDWAWEAVKAKGTTLYLLVRDSAKKAAQPFTTADEYSYYEAVTDEPVRGERSGFIKFRIALGVQDAATHRKVVATA